MELFLFHRGDLQVISSESVSFLSLWIHSPWYIQNLRKMLVGINNTCKESGRTWFMLWCYIIGYCHYFSFLFRQKIADHVCAFLFDEGDVTVTSVKTTKSRKKYILSSAGFPGGTGTSHKMGMWGVFNYTEAKMVHILILQFILRGIL